MDIITRKMDRVTGLTAAAQERGKVTAKRLARSDIIQPLSQVIYMNPTLLMIFGLGIKAVARYPGQPGGHQILTFFSLPRQSHGLG